MLKSKNRLSLILAFLAIFSFAVISVGGESFHNKIHHHQDRSSHNQCPVYQLQAQVLIALPAIFLALSFCIAFRSIKIYQKVVVQSHYSLPPLRAPPSLL